jgi:hypothetical protein
MIQNLFFERDVSKIASKKGTVDFGDKMRKKQNFPGERGARKQDLADETKMWREERSRILLMIGCREDGAYKEINHSVRPSVKGLRE